MYSATNLVHDTDCSLTCLFFWFLTPQIKLLKHIGLKEFVCETSVTKEMTKEEIYLYLIDEQSDEEFIDLAIISNEIISALQSITWKEK